MTILQKKFLALFFILIACLGLAGFISGQPAPSTSPLRAYGQFAPDTGWILLGEQLYSTADGGQAWREISPPTADHIWSVYFLDENQGWALVSPPAPAEQAPPRYQLLATSDGGLSWGAPLDLPFTPFPELPDQPPAAAHLSFVDPQAGWLVFEMPTSSNFSQGTLWHTLDGGTSWTQRTLPIGEPVYFGDRLQGYTSGGPAEDEHYTTEDGGQTWQPYGEPPPLAGELPGGATPDPALASIQMLNASDGWALELHGDCPPDLKPQSAPGESPGAQSSALITQGPALSACSQTQRLMQTGDGGLSWNPLLLPDGADSLTLAAAPEQLLAGQAFDKCEIPTRSELQTWWNSSPYRTVNLYIGGVARSCANLALNADFLSDLDRQGWRLIPTWVGPQAACSNYLNRMSYNPATAYQQGVAEANAAAATAGGLRLWRQALYYDLEAFPGGNTACLDAAKSFMNGWTYRLHELGYVSGVYGSPCYSGLKDFSTLNNPPDGAWIAHWIYPAYNPNASVWGVACMNDSYYPNHQRLRQYTGGHFETWGPVTLAIDSNVMDGIVAQAYGEPPTVCPRPAAPAAAGVILYTAMNYDCYTRQAGHGYVWRARSGLQNLSSFFENRASSIYIPPGWSARLYEGLNGTGGKVCLNGSDLDFAGQVYDNGAALDNTASSFAVFAGANCSEPAPVTPPADTTAPLADITSHESGGFIAGSLIPVAITADLQDQGSGISHAQFFAGFDNGSGWSWHSLGYDSDGGDGWSGAWTPGVLAELDEIGFYVYAWDKAGNGSGTSALHLKISDSQPPASALAALPASLDTTAISLAWQGSDNLSGVHHYDLQVQVDGGAWANALTGIPGDRTSAVYYASLGHSFGFRLRAVDNAGNPEAFPSGAEATTLVNSCNGDAFEADNSLATAKPLPLDQVQAHTICGLGDQDWVVLPTQAGTAYIFFTANLGATADTVLSLHDAQGNKLAENDNSPGTTARGSYIFWQAGVSGPLYLRVAHVDGRVAGSAVSNNLQAATTRITHLPLIHKNQ